MSESLIESYFRVNTLVNQQLLSYNKFVDIGIQQVVDMIGKISTNVEGFELKLGKVRIEQPRYYEVKGGYRQILPYEARLRNLAWIEDKRRRVDEATHGRVGYVFVPSTGLDGQAELARQFYGQFDKDGLIIDERFNNGGQIPDRFVELLDRPLLSFWAVRDGQDMQWPPVAHNGPSVMLVNGLSGSGGDAFPFYFKERGVGPLIGTRTWGGLIGISGVPGLVDGGGITVPTFAIYSTDGKWIIEGHGVDPDIVVEDDPAQQARGIDPQLEAGIAEVTSRLQTNPPVLAKRPAPADRSRPKTLAAPPPAVGESGSH